jgi:hypothetical protein
MTNKDAVIRRPFEVVRKLMMIIGALDVFRDVSYYIIVAIDCKIDKRLTKVSIPP